MSVVIQRRGLIRHVFGFFEHAAAVLVGLVLMIVGLGMGVTMIMLPVGVAIGLLGVAILIGGLFARIDS